MIAAWIFYCAVWALWLSAVAWVAERFLLNTRGPVRMVWLSAMVLSAVGPIVGYAVSRRERVAPVASLSSTAASTAGIVIQRSSLSHGADIGTSVRTAVAGIDRPLGIAWVASILGLLLYIGGGVIRLRIVRRRWRPDVVAGTAVMISDDTGPALVGVFDTTIVIPAWALELESDALALMLRHELEHRAAGDTRTLAIAQALLVLMPWNPLLWWQLRRLRLAIELDCDARVLRRTSDVAAYGRLLIEFGRSPRDFRVVSAALADHQASQLEARIRRMTRHLPARRGRVIAVSIAATVIAIIVGCQLPTPPAPAPSDASRSTQPTRPDSVIVARDTALSSRTARGRMLDTMDVRDRELIASMNRELERRKAELSRTLREAQARGEVGKPSRDPLVKQWFDAQLALSEARDSATRSRGQTQLESVKREFDSLSATLVGQQFVVDAQRHDSLSRELARLRATLTDEAPQIKRPVAELQQERSLSDSVLALGGPGCGVDGKQPGKPSIKFVVSESDLSRLDKVEFVVAESTSPGAALETRGLSCSTAVQGQIKYFGYGAYHSAITIRTNPETSLIVVTGSGRVLAGPVAIKNEARRYEVPLRR